MEWGQVDRNGLSALQEVCIVTRRTQMEVAVIPLLADAICIIAIYRVPKLEGGRWSQVRLCTCDRLGYLADRDADSCKCYIVLQGLGTVAK